MPVEVRDGFSDLLFSYQHDELFDAGRNPLAVIVDRGTVVGPLQRDDTLDAAVDVVLDILRIARRDNMVLHRAEGKEGLRNHAEVAADALHEAFELIDGFQRVESEIWEHSVLIGDVRRPFGLIFPEVP